MTLSTAAELELTANRLNKSSSIGFDAVIKDKNKDENILDKVSSEDLREFGMIPEFLGRLPIICTLHPLDEDMMVSVLTQPKNAILKQYGKLLYKISLSASCRPKHKYIGFFNTDSVVTVLIIF